MKYRCPSRFARQTTPLNKEDLNYAKFLQDIAREQNFEVTYVDIEEVSKSGEIVLFLKRWSRFRSFSVNVLAIGKYQCLVQLSTLPVAVCYGTGNDRKDAQASAAHNALEYLKIMTK